MRRPGRFASAQCLKRGYRARQAGARLACPPSAPGADHHRISSTAVDTGRSVAALSEEMRLVMSAWSQPRRTHGHVRRALTVVCVLSGAVSPALAQPSPPAFPITLQDAIRYASDHYPAIRAAQARVAAQESGVDLAHTAYLPRVDSSLQINRATRNNVAGLLVPGTTIPAISGPVSDDTSWSSIWGSGAGVLVSWEAFDFGQRGASVDLARAFVVRANAGADITRLEVAVKTADAFLRLAAAQETVRAARANIERQQVFANAVAVLVKNQLRPGADDSRAQAELALARIQAIQAEQAEQIARANLAQWLGVRPATVQIAGDPLLQLPPPEPAVSPAVAAHPVAEAQLAAVEASVALQH